MVEVAVYYTTTKQYVYVSRKPFKNVFLIRFGAYQRKIPPLCALHKLAERKRWMKYQLGRQIYVQGLKVKWYFLWVNCYHFLPLGYRGVCLQSFQMFRVQHHCHLDWRSIFDSLDMEIRYQAQLFVPKGGSTRCLQNIAQRQISSNFRRRRVSSKQGRDGKTRGRHRTA